MLSRKVTCAIIILNELFSSPPDRRTGEKMVRRATLAESCRQESRTFRRVMQALHMSRYLYMMNLSVTLTCDPTHVTIYDLFISLHGGIPLGEEMVCVLRPSYYTHLGAPSIERLEREANEAMKKYFECKTVASVFSTQKSKEYILKYNITE